MGVQVKRVLLTNGFISVGDLQAGLYFVSINGVTTKILKEGSFK